ncbi:XRE family transcriptional regulator [Halosquirtibacter laminarini]|uniref:XRE family transcriptional regulator n=1 Tax=Halosquirtibacter laminarini TaxID=3374600 RepID=A0AC61NHI3_9BACT|nr:XRE family transcriptional regulator [Prolixibacteraceae bacterium]
MKDIFSKRLKNARIKQNLSLDKLSDSMDKIVSKNALSKYEKGEMLPNSNVLIKLSNILEVSIDYFFRPFEIVIDQLEFRKKSNLPVSDKKRIVETVKDYIERYIELENITNKQGIFKNPAEKIHVLGSDDVIDSANIIRREWELGKAPIPSVIDLLEKNHIKIIEINAVAKFDGLSGYINDEIPFIVINKNFNVERKRFTILHELGHIVLNFNKYLEQNSIEKYCNEFSSELLLPGSVIIDLLSNKRHNIVSSEISKIQEQYGISFTAIVYKLQELNILPTYKVKKFFIKRNSESVFKQYVDKSRYMALEESNRFNSLINHAITEELITISKAAALSMSNVNELKESLTYI